MSDPVPSERRAASTSLGELVGEVTRDMSTLMRQELALAKAEVKDSASKSAKGAGMLGGAGYAAGMVLLFLSVALWAALATVMGEGWSAVVVALVWAIIAAVLFALGRAQLKKVEGVPQTAATLQEIPEAFTRNEENR
ncbi:MULTISPECIES: phage holin family protein [Microbacterium]|uniref:phage holin family protein n=1 Tax=Microbacterium TaxID=33882 RepID=UPI001F9CF199|nr:phage holin family protein [Actinomycetota bacterium]